MVSKKQVSAYNPRSRKCSFCLNEKFEITEDKENNLLNKRGDTKISSSEQVYVKNSGTEDPIPRRHIETNLSFYRNF